MPSLDELKQGVFDYVRLRLGDGMVSVELDPEHYEMAYAKAVQTYREYILPQEVTTVRQIFRRTIGSTGQSAGNQFEPFEAGYLNTYLLKVGRTGGLLSYELYTQYQEMTARMFGGYVNYTFNPVTKKLIIVRRPQNSGETFLLWTFNMKPEIQLLSDYRTSNWIRDYTYSMSKYTLGEARSKFGQIAGPQGGTTLNGEALKNEAKEEMEKLMEDLKLYIDGSQPLHFIIG